MYNQSLPITKSKIGKHTIVQQNIHLLNKMEKENKHEKDPTRKMEELTMDLLKEPNSKYPLMMQGKND